MPKPNIGRVIGAVVAGWFANAIMAAAVEVLMWTMMRNPGGRLPGRYYIIDLISQCCFTVAGGYLCCAIAGPARQGAMFGLIALGLLIGGLTLPSSWTREPHWYRLALLAVWAPCVWIGWTLRSQRPAAQQSLATK